MFDTLFDVAENIQESFDYKTFLGAAAAIGYFGTLGYAHYGASKKEEQYIAPNVKWSEEKRYEFQYCAICLKHI